MATIVIVGANRGIGLALARQYSDAGDRVFALCRDPGSADELAKLAESSGGAVTIAAADMADDASVARAVQAIGDTPIDLLLNVGGIFRNAAGPEDNDFADWRESFEVMTIGPFRMSVALLPNLERAGGKILSLSSQAGASTWPMGGMYPYVAAKAALNRSMASLAIDLKDRGIAVGLVHPGYVLTDMGGPDAEITAQESAAGIRDVATKLDLENSGGFWNWNGEPHAW